MDFAENTLVEEAARRDFASGFRTADCSEMVSFSAFSANGVFCRTVFSGMQFFSAARTLFSGLFGRAFIMRACAQLFASSKPWISFAIFSRLHRVDISW